MPNLSFARIMYGSNEDSTVSTWMQSSSFRSQFSALLPLSATSSQNWIQKLLSAVMPIQEGSATGSPKKLS